MKRTTESKREIVKYQLRTTSQQLKAARISKGPLLGDEQTTSRCGVGEAIDSIHEDLPITHNFFSF
jgi:hypothetical protein